MWMTMQVTSLGVDMADGDLRAIRNVRESVLHTTPAERMLERRAHEPVPVSSRVKDVEMDGEHAEIEEEGDEDE